MSVRGKLRRGRRRLICRLIGHDWGEWEADAVAVIVHHAGTWGGSCGPIPVYNHRYRECKRCPQIEWR